MVFIVGWLSVVVSRPRYNIRIADTQRELWDALPDRQQCIQYSHLRFSTITR